MSTKLDDFKLDDLKQNVKEKYYSLLDMLDSLAIIWVCQLTCIIVGIIHSVQALYTIYE